MLNWAVHLLVAGRFPYAADTYLGNPATPMPGALLPGLPFIVSGNAAWQRGLAESVLGAVVRAVVPRPV